MQACGDFLLEGLHSGRWAYWIAEDDGKVVAQVCIQIIAKVPRPNCLNPRMGYITNVYTRPAYRGQGTGGRLLQHSIAWARQQDLDALVLWPAEGREAFYGRAGFNLSKALERSLQD